MIDLILARTIEVKSDYGVCKIWQGGTSGTKGRGKGYPRMYYKGKTVATHRLLYELEKGEIPEDLQVDHKCNNRLCLNIKHLELVTQVVNCLRREERKREKNVSLATNSSNTRTRNFNESMACLPC